MATSPRSTHPSQLMFLSEELPASPSALLENERDWTTHVVTSRSSSLRLLTDYGPAGWYGRTSPALCRTMEAGRLEPFSGSWGNSGMGSHTEFLTLSTSEFR